MRLLSINKSKCFSAFFSIYVLISLKYVCRELHYIFRITLILHCGRGHAIPVALILSIMNTLEIFILDQPRHVISPQMDPSAVYLPAQTRTPVSTCSNRSTKLASIVRVFVYCFFFFTFSVPSKPSNQPYLISN